MYVCTYDQDIVELLHAVYLGQQLVDYSVMDACAACHAATLLTDCVNLIKYDDVKAAVGTELLGKERRRKINDRKKRKANVLLLSFKCLNVCTVLETFIRCVMILQSYDLVQTSILEPHFSSYLSCFVFVFGGLSKYR